MKVSLQSFYASFYGRKFTRWFRRPQEFVDDRRFKIQYQVRTPKRLFALVKRNSGYYPCLTSTYSYGADVNLYKDNYKASIIIDRLFMDFDRKLPAPVHVVRKRLTDLRKRGLEYKAPEQSNLEKKLRDYVIEEGLAEPAINEAKDFALRFKNEFGKSPALVFSDFKGCHAYPFFEPVDLFHLNRTVAYFAKKIKETYEYSSIDLSVNEDADVRLSRVPYSVHQLTNLSVVPFKLSDSYEEIVEKSLDPTVEPFHVDDHLNNFGEHLKTIDSILTKNQAKRLHHLHQRQAKINSGPMRTDFKRIDHREFFRELIGEPAREYPDKEYVMYRCPFPDHPDNDPSFQVHKTGYKCHACGRKGNYWQILKDINGWDDGQVRRYLKNKK